METQQQIKKILMIMIFGIVLFLTTILLDVAILLPGGERMVIAVSGVLILLYVHNMKRRSKIFLIPSDTKKYGICL
jgi:hypothetical protein